MTQLDSQDYTIEDEEMLSQKATKKSSENKDIFAGHAELLEQSQYDPHVRLQRYFRSIGCPELANCVDFCGAIPFYALYPFRYIVTIFLIIGLGIKFGVPLYYLSQPFYYCGLPLTTILLMNGVFDLFFYVLLLIPSFHGIWRDLIPIDLGRLTLISIALFFPLQPDIICPTSLIASTYIITTIQIVSYVLLSACIIHRWWTTLYDPTHVAFLEPISDPSYTNSTFYPRNTFDILDWILYSTKIRSPEISQEISQHQSRNSQGYDLQQRKQEDGEEDTQSPRERKLSDEELDDILLPVVKSHQYRQITNSNDDDDDDDDVDDGNISDIDIDDLTEN